MKEKPTRKRLRLEEYDYSSAGYYFVTICTKDRKCVLGHIDSVGSADPCAPLIGQTDAFGITLSNFGKIVERYLQSMDIHYQGIKVDKYVIMPNHIHAIIIIAGSGGQGSARPTNTTLSTIIHSFKRLTNREYCCNIWQTSFYDHVIRNEQDYLRIWEYIDTNAVKMGNRRILYLILYFMQCNKTLTDCFDVNVSQ